MADCEMEDAAGLSPEVLAEADALGVPSDARLAFAEYFEALSEASGGKLPSKRQLARWGEQFRKARPMAEVHQYIGERSDDFGALVQAAGGPEFTRFLEQRLTFMGVYAAGTPLNELFAQLEEEIRMARSSDLSSQKFQITPGIYDDRHAKIRAAAYPYRPACCASHGDPVMECICVSSNGKGPLAGFLAMQGSYADDLSVHPRFQGQGVAKALVGGVAMQLASEGELEMSLDVRACNLPAIGLYRSIGFAIARKYYPSFYDWHGGYRMVAPTNVVAQKLPRDRFDVSTILGST